MDSSEKSPEQVFAAPNESSIETQPKSEILEPVQLEKDTIEQSDNVIQDFINQSEHMVGDYEKSHNGESVSEGGILEIQELNKEAVLAGNELRKDLEIEGSGNESGETVSIEKAGDSGFMDSDPRFKTIANELSDVEIAKRLQIIKKDDPRMADWEAVWRLERSSLGVFFKDEEGQLRLFMHPGAVQKVFKERFPEDYAVYLAKEHTRVYNRPDDDPQYRELSERLKSLQDAYKDVEEKSSYIVNTGGAGTSGWRQYKPQNPEHSADISKVYKEFAAQYPEKAKAYRKFDAGMSADLNSLGKKDERELRHDMASPDQRLQAEYDSYVATYPAQAELFRESSNKIDDALKRRVTEKINESSVVQMNAIEQSETQQSGYNFREISSEQDLFNGIREQIRAAKENGISFDEPSLLQRQEALAERPIIDAAVLEEAQGNPDEQPMFSWVETDKIVGRPFGGQNQQGWGFEYGNRKGRIADLAKKISAMENDEDLDRIFHPSQPKERIKLRAIEGPRGPLYAVEDGTHRVAGSMVSELHEIPCEVKRLKYPLEQITTDEETAGDWKIKIKLGLIDGRLDKLRDDTRGDHYKLTVKKEILPWIRTASQRTLIKISRLYEKLYPGSLDKLVIPRDALVDPIANNYFMSEKWKEWKDKFAKNERDEDGMILY